MPSGLKTTSRERQPSRPCRGLGASRRPSPRSLRPRRSRPRRRASPSGENATREAPPGDLRTRIRLAEGTDHSLTPASPALATVLPSRAKTASVTLPLLLSGPERLPVTRSPETDAAAGVPGHDDRPIRAEPGDGHRGASLQRSEPGACRRAPDPGGAVRAGSHDQAAVGAELGIFDRALVRKNVQQVPAANAPDPGGAVGACRDDAPPGRVERRLHCVAAVGASQGEQLLVELGVPEPRRVVGAPAEQRASVPAPGDRRHSRTVADEIADQAAAQAAVRRQHVHGPVGAAIRQEEPARAPRDCVDRTVVKRKVEETITLRHVPDPNAAVLSRNGEQVAVRAEGRGGRHAGLVDEAPTDLPAAAGVPEVRAHGSPASPGAVVRRERDALELDRLAPDFRRQHVQQPAGSRRRRREPGRAFPHRASRPGGRRARRRPSSLPASRAWQRDGRYPCARASRRARWS